jgi:hypothetical protein
MLENSREWWEFHDQESLGLQNLIDYSKANGGFLESLKQWVKWVHWCSVAGKSIGRLGWQGLVSKMVSSNGAYLV